MNRMPDTRKIEDSPGSMYLRDEAIDRAVGAVVGSAVGDALGAYYETTYPLFDEEITMRPGGGFNHRRARGGWTDDTSMSLGILDALAAGHAEAAAEHAAEVADHRAAGRGVPDRPDWGWEPPPIRVPDMAANFLAWYRSRPPEVGRQTAAVLSAARGPADVAAAAKRYTAGNPNSAGNGALMRTTAVALSGYMPDSVAPLAAEAAALTHPHPDSVDACVVWSLAVHQAIHENYDWKARDELFGDEVYEKPIEFAKAVRGGLVRLPDEARRRRWGGLIDEVLATPDFIEARTRFCPNGWVVTAFQAALWAIVSVPERSPQQHFREALTMAVRIGHDTDTVAAIAGGLLGARWGLAAIPAEWTRHLHGDRVRGETVTGAELATVAMRAFDCTMRRFFEERAARFRG